MTQEYSLDLSTFFRVLCRKALILVGCTLVGGAIGYGLTYTQTPTWKAQAQFDQPSVAELGNYYALFNTYQWLNGHDGVSYKLLKNEAGQFSLAPEKSSSSEELAREQSYGEFIRTLNSPDALQTFLVQSDDVRVIAQSRNQSIAAAAEGLADRFQFQPASKSQPIDRLSLTLENPEQAATLLADFIQYANAQTRAQLNNELVQKWKVLFDQVRAAADGNLGAIQHGAQVSAQDWKGKLTLMQRVQPLDDKLVAYRLVKAPSAPLSPDSPNRNVWLMIGALSGLLLGLALVALLAAAGRKSKND